MQTYTLKWLFSSQDRELIALRDNREMWEAAELYVSQARGKPWFWWPYTKSPAGVPVLDVKDRAKPEEYQSLCKDHKDPIEAVWKYPEGEPDRDATHFDRLKNATMKVTIWTHHLLTNLTYVTEGAGNEQRKMYLGIVDRVAAHRMRTGKIWLGGDGEHAAFSTIPKCDHQALNLWMC